MDISKILSHCDHTLLAVDATWEQIKQVCDDGIRFSTASVCIPASYVAKANEYVGDKLPICTVIGFPNGYSTTDVLNEIKVVKEACGGKILKVIIETCLLTDDEKKEMCRVVTESGADFIKTSTGFSKGGATREDIALFAENIGPNVRMKAAGGIRSFEDAEDFLALGCDRLGTSAIVKLAKKQTVSGY